MTFSDVMANIAPFVLVVIAGLCFTFLCMAWESRGERIKELEERVAKLEGKPLPSSAGIADKQTIS